MGEGRGEGGLTPIGGRSGSEGTPAASGGVSVSLAGGEGRRSRPDFNMLIDVEDHASVARVVDEFPTLSNPLKLLAQVGSDEVERRRGGERSV